MGAIPDVVMKYLVPGAGSPSPAELYEEAAPRIQAVLKQYDRLAPKIDFMAESWPLFMVTTFTLGALAVIGGNYIYGYMTGKR